MAGIRALRKIQLGRETTAGTITAATTRWRGTGVLADRGPVVFPAEDVGYLSGVGRTYRPKLEAGMAMDEVEATFEQLPHILEGGIKAATPANDGSGSGKIRTYTFPTTQGNTIKTYTLEGGDNQQAEVMEYGHVTGFNLKGASGEAWKVSADWRGRQLTKQVFTTAASLPSVEEILFGQTKIYIDPVSGTFGTTQKMLTLLAASLNVPETGMRAKWTADGQLYFSFVATLQPEVTLDLTFEHDATAVAEVDAARAQTPRLIRLLAEGSMFTTAGSSYTKKTMIIDLAGKYEIPEGLDDQDGNDIRTLTFRARYDPTEAFFGRIVVVNALAALP